MDELINQNEMCSNTLEKDFDVTIDENKHITQFDIIEQSIEDNQTTETLSYPEPNTENITSMIDESDDEPLLSIPPRPNNRKICSHYWLEILIGSIIVVIVTMILTAGLLFTKDFKISSSISVKGCDKKSETGKSCSIDNLETVMLLKHKDLSFSGKPLNSVFVYAAPSNRTIITFSFNKGFKFYLDNVSIIDTSNNVELIKDGGFDSGTLYSYCVCDSSFTPTKPTKNYRSDSYVCEVNNFFSSVQLSQSVNTIAGREYNVSFWLQSEFGLDNTVTVYISSAFKMNSQGFISLVLTGFSIILFII